MLREANGGAGSQMTTPSQAKLVVLPDQAAVARAAADWIVVLAARGESRFALCLSGGSTPKALYALLATPEYRDRLPWTRLHLFWGDERFVPHDDPRSNFRMTSETLLAHAPIPTENVHPIPTEGLDVQQGAAAYAETLQEFYGATTLDPQRPLFDVTLLGLGTNGHTASLFPKSPVLKERARWAAPVEGVADEARVTLTYPVIESSRETAFLVVGAEKAEMLARLRAGDATIPAGALHTLGATTIFADTATTQGVAR